MTASVSRFCSSLSAILLRMLARYAGRVRRCIFQQPPRTGTSCMTSTAAGPSSAPAREPHLANPDQNPSFTKGIFLGELREELCFPFPAMRDDDRESLRLVLDSF